MAKRGGELDLWWHIGLATVGAGYRALLHCRYHGLDHLPREGPALLASNHVSVLDPIAIALGTASRGRALRFLTAADFFSHPVLGPGLRLLRQIPVRRGVRDLAALEELTRVLSSGGLAGIFPEGRVADRGASGRLRGRSGMVRVARATGVPIVPVGIWGTQDRWSREHLEFSRPLRTPVMVAFGGPILIDPDPHGAGDAGETRRATARIMSAIQALSAKARDAQRAERLRLLPPDGLPT